MTICAENLKINTFGNENSQNSLGRKVRFQLKTAENKSIATKVYVTPLICFPVKNQPLNLRKKHFEKYNVNFADHGHLGDEIDLLTGIDYYWTFMTEKVQQLHEFCNLLMLESVFGWILCGWLNAGDNGNHVVNTNVTHVLRVFAKDKYNCKIDVYKFRNLETLRISEKESSCYDNYRNSIKKHSNGRYKVELPFKENHPVIHDHFVICKKRLCNTFTRLNRNPELLKQYDIFKQQLKTGIIEEVNEEGVVGETHYTPHHPVIRNGKTITKVRIVFDASASSNGPSLKSCLYKGPQLTPLAFDILPRFRFFKVSLHFVALVSDTEKAFHRISVIPEQRKYLRFLWVDDVFKNSTSIVKLRLARVVFGVTSPTFLLNRTVRNHVSSYHFDPDFDFQ